MSNNSFEIFLDGEFIWTDAGFTFPDRPTIHSPALWTAAGLGLITRNPINCVETSAPPPVKRWIASTTVSPSSGQTMVLPILLLSLDVQEAIQPHRFWYACWRVTSNDQKTNWTQAKDNIPSFPSRLTDCIHSYSSRFCKEQLVHSSSYLESHGQDHHQGLWYFIKPPSAAGPTKFKFGSRL